jgi:tetratricopeptide (TPR) repeat protein
MTSMQGRVSSVVTIAALVCGFTALAFADEAGKQRANALFEDGRKYLAQKEYALACTAFEQSHASDPAIGTQLNIALCYEQWGKLASAYRAYVEAERLAEAKKDSRAAGARKKMDEIAPKVPHLTFTIPDDVDPSTVFLFDGKEIEAAKLKDDLLVDAGKHTVDARVPGRPGKVTAVEVMDGERRNITIEVPKPQVVTVVQKTERNKLKFYGGIAGIAGGTVMVGLASLVALSARQDYRDTNCPDHMCLTQGDLDQSNAAISRARNATWLGLGGLALTGVGVWLLLTSKTTVTSEEPRDATAWQLRPVFGADSVGLVVGGSL